MSPTPLSSLFLPKLSHCSVLEGGRQAADRWCLGAGSPWGPGFCEPCPACRSPWVPLTTHLGALLTPPSCFSLLSIYYLDPLQPLNPPQAATPTSRSSSISASCDQASSLFHCHPPAWFSSVSGTTVRQVTEATCHFLVPGPSSSPFTSSPSMDPINSISKRISDPHTSLHRLCHHLLSVL